MTGFKVRSCCTDTTSASYTRLQSHRVPCHAGINLMDGIQMNDLKGLAGAFSKVSAELKWTASPGVPRLALWIGKILIQAALTHLCVPAPLLQAKTSPDMDPNNPDHVVQA